MCAMNKRIAAAVLWLLAGSYLGALLAHMVGVSDVLGPILGVAAAALIAGDPRGLIWNASTGSSGPSSPRVSSPNAVLDR